MNRLTKKIKDEYSLLEYEAVYEVDAINKLGKLEDIEEELGCPLEIVFKAITKGIVAKTKYGTDNRTVDLGKHYLKYCLTCEEPQSFGDWDCEEYRKPQEYYYLKDYRKTWWLKDETK